MAEATAAAECALWKKKPTPSAEAISSVPHSSGKACSDIFFTPPIRSFRSRGGVSPDLFFFLTESKRSGERLPKAAHRVNAVNQFAGFLGLTGRSRCQQTEFFDKINIIKKIEIRRAGAFGERMWLSKKKTSASEIASVSLF